MFVRDVSLEETHERERRELEPFKGKLQIMQMKHYIREFTQGKSSIQQKIFRDHGKPLTRFIGMNSHICWQREKQK